MMLRFCSLAFLVLSLGLAEARYHKRTEHENCNKLADAVQAVFDGIPSYIKCFISKASESLLGFDVTARQTIERISCLLTDNSDNGLEMFDALDSAGYIDKLIEVAYSMSAVQGGSLVGEMRRQGITAELNKCSLETPDGSYFSELVDSDDFENLAQMLDDLQLFSITPEMTTKIAILVGAVVPFGPIKSAPEPCTCSAITDPEQRCRMAKEATAPFIQVAMKNERMLRGFTEINSYVQQFTGVSLFTNFSTDAAQIVCDTAKIQSVSGHRALLEDYGLLQVGFELGIGFGCVGIQSLRRSAHRVIDQHENVHGNAYWKPSEQDVAINRAVLNLADVWLEVGLGSVRLDNVPAMPQMMIQQMCRVTETGTPDPHFGTRSPY